MSGPNPSGLCMCGCGEPTRLALRNHAQHGWVKDEPLKYLAGHCRLKSPVEYIKRDAGYVTRCWIWQRAKTSFGYGQVNLGGTWARAHRLYYERFRGPVPTGLVLDHLCCNPACVNPHHLEAVTNAENCRRGARAKLNHAAVTQIRQSTESSAAIASRLGLSYDTVWAARTGRSWS